MCITSLKLKIMYSPRSVCWTGHPVNCNNLVDLTRSRSDVGAAVPTERRQQQQWQPA